MITNLGHIDTTGQKPQSRGARIEEAQRAVEEAYGELGRRKGITAKLADDLAQASIAQDAALERTGAAEVNLARVLAEELAPKPAAKPAPAVAAPPIGDDSTAKVYPVNGVVDAGADALADGGAQRFETSGYAQDVERPVV